MIVSAPAGFVESAGDRHIARAESELGQRAARSRRHQAIPTALKPVRQASSWSDGLQSLKAWLAEAWLPCRCSQAFCWANNPAWEHSRVSGSSNRVATQEAMKVHSTALCTWGETCKASQSVRAHGYWDLQLTNMLPAPDDIPQHLWSIILHAALPPNADSCFVIRHLLQVSHMVHSMSVARWCLSLSEV